MIIKFLNFSKRHNSTIRPPETAAYTEYEIVFKQSTSINTPVIKLDTGDSGMPQFNYAYIPDLHTYYYVTDIILSNNNIFEIHLDIDVLATAKPYIKASSAFCKYIADENYINEYLRDDRILATSEIETLLSTNTFTDLIPYNKNSYSWMLTTFSKEDGLASYFVSGLTIEYLTEQLTADGTSVWGNLVQLFGDAKNSIIDIHYVPFKLELLQSAEVVADHPSRIYLGDYDTGSDGYLFNTYLYQITDLISLPSDRYRDFRICEPYTECKLYAPLIGCMDIALDEFEDASSISFKYVINLSNGNVSFVLTKDGGKKVISTSSGNFSLSMPLVFQQMSSAINALVGITALVGGVASGGALTVAGIAGGIASFASSFKKTTTAVNSFSGNFSTDVDRVMRLSVIKHSVSEEPENLRTLYGRPCGKIVNLQNVDGYVQTEEFHLLAPLDAVIINQVESLMDSGIYLE